LKNLLQRTISGLIYLIIIIGSLFVGKLAFGAVLLFMGILALIEFSQLSNGSWRTLYTYFVLSAGAIIFILSFLAASRVIPLYWLTLLLLVPVLLFITAIYSLKQNVVNKIAISFLGIAYIIIPLALINYIIFPNSNNNEYTHRVILGILSLVWVNDTGAYIVGMPFGRHKLFPRVSPKKSWEGFAGATVFTLLASFWLNRVFGDLSKTDWIILGCIVSVFGVYGDLAESIIKRDVNKKESGNLIPGHGGILDRIDSLLFVIPVSFLYMIIKGL
jgi:phosphatidate cytidylyltransferase